jgi:putative SOS response-associated peptidase YedK
MIDNAKSQALAKLFGVSPADFHYSDDIAPGSGISIIHDQGGKRRIDTATWWLFLDHATLKPNYKYASFNSRSDKLHKKTSLAYGPYRKTRCIIPATAFIEGTGDKKTYHRIELEDQGIAFGGLYKEHLNQDTGEVLYSASIITLPPLTEWKDVHPKSTPLMLPAGDGELINAWLDPNTETEKLAPLLTPSLWAVQRLTPIGKPSQWNPVGDSFTINPA